ncbi:hypothetical protein OG21DRAFT_1508393 [Imleria badia]|nr:hypothetical protein OG21DRAFT_1508393 [Imleria badia]
MMQRLFLPRHFPHSLASHTAAREVCISPSQDASSWSRTALRVSAHPYSFSPIFHSYSQLTYLGGVQRSIPFFLNSSLRLPYIGRQSTSAVILALSSNARRYKFGTVKPVRSWMVIPMSHGTPAVLS